MGKENKLSPDELRRTYSKEKMTSLKKLRSSYVIIRQFVDFSYVLEKNEDDYKDEINIQMCKNTQLHPSDILTHYICLEACNFYETLKVLKREDKSLPKLPSYFSLLQRIRNKVIAHRDTKCELPNAENIFQLLEEFHHEVTMKDLIENIYKSHDIIVNKLGFE